MNKVSLSLMTFGIALGLHGAPAIGETLYNCVGQDGSEVLQNMPCQTGSQVWAEPQTAEARNVPAAPGASSPADRPAPAADSAPPNPAAADAAQPPSAEAASAESEDSANLPGEPALGMSQQQVKAILGEPSAITQEEVVQGKVVTWSYGDSRVLQFDTSGRLATK